MKPYQPINCNFYDILEATAVKRKTVPIVIIEDEIQKTIESKIIDLYAKDSIEYMVMENDKTIRLDQIVSVDGVILEGFGCGI
jgi:Rho-binding antiterminator